MSALLCNESSNYGKNVTAITGIISDALDAVVCSHVYRFNLSVHPSPSREGGGGGGVGDSAYESGGDARRLP